MSPDSSVRDFYEPDVPTDADPSPLRRVILAQSEAPAGAAVLMFSTPVLDPADGEAFPGDPDRAAFVRETAAELGISNGPPDLFSLDAYVLQSALGEHLLAERPPVPASDGRRANVSSWTDRHSAALLRSPLLALNYHAIAREHTDEVEAMLRRVARFGPSLDFDAPTGDPGPRILVTFYDSYRFAGLFGADLCHRLGIRACFFPLFEPTDEPGCAELTDDELRSIAEVHELGFHTSSHVAADEVTHTNVDREVVQPLRRIEAITGSVPRVAAWRAGARFDARRLGDGVLRDAGVGSLISNWSLERIPGSEA